MRGQRRESIKALWKPVRSHHNSSLNALSNTDAINVRLRRNSSLPVDCNSRNALTFASFDGLWVFTWIIQFISAITVKKQKRHSRLPVMSSGRKVHDKSNQMLPHSFIFPNTFLFYSFEKF